MTPTRKSDFLKSRSASASSFSVSDTSVQTQTVTCVRHGEPHAGWFDGSAPTI